MSLKKNKEMIAPEDLERAVNSVINHMNDIDNLYPVQMTLFKALLGKDNIFFTSATNSGKTLPVLIFPYIVEKLSEMGYPTQGGKVLFVTPLNSIKMSMISNARMMGISCEGLTSKNYAALLESSDIKVLFVSPEVLKISAVSTALLAHRKDFGLKCIDEVHLGMLSIYK